MKHGERVRQVTKPLIALAFSARVQGANLFLLLD